MPSEVSYRRSSENVGDEERITVKPFSESYHRFSVLERVLMLAVSVLIVLAIVFCILYAASEASGRRNRKNAIIDTLDWSVDPCNDFYNFSCNKWMSVNHIPSGQRRIDQFGRLQEVIDAFLTEKLQHEDTIKKYEHVEAVSKALNDYTACMDYVHVTESERDVQARKYISDYGGWNLSISGWSRKTWKFLPNLIKIHRNLKIFPLFFVVVKADIKNSTRNQIVVIQRASYYIKRETYFATDSSHRKLRQLYKDLMLSAIAAMANTSKNDTVVVRQVREIYEFEKLLAKISMPTSQALNVEALYNPITIKELQDATGNKFKWLDYFQGLFRDTGVPITTETQVNVNQLDYLKNMTQILATVDDVLLANYMVWEVICQSHLYFPRAISKKFSSYFEIVYRMKSETDRVKRCLTFTRDVLGLPLSILYIDEKLGGNELKFVEEMVATIRKVYIGNTRAISWMDPETKRMALKKAKAIKENVGYPKILTDYDKLNKKYAELEIKNDDHFGNWIRKRMFDMKRTLQSLQKQVDKSRWSSGPLFNNAYYSRTENKIVLPAGILQPPFFDISRPMSLNYGGIGMIVGHELTHSFDNKGREYDEHGNYFNWWKNSSLMEFKRRTACLKEKYSKYSYQGVKIDGKKTLDENIADDGGIKQAFQAYQAWNREHDEPPLPGLNLTNNQLFFIGFAQIWCGKRRYSPGSIFSGNHAPGMVRVNGTLTNYPEFSKAFKCPVGSRMNPKEKCDIW